MLQNKLHKTNNALDKLIKNLKSFCKKKMGKGETIIEGIILEPPINCKYNPYYNHFLNGADTICLVKNMSIILNISSEKYIESDQKKIMELFPIMDKFGNLLRM